MTITGMDNGCGCALKLLIHIFPHCMQWIKAAPCQSLRSQLHTSKPHLSGPLIIFASLALSPCTQAAPCQSVRSQLHTSKPHLSGPLMMFA